MATKIGSISTGTLTSSTETNISINENVGGIIFDIHDKANVFKGFANARQNFEDGQVQCVNSMAEVEALGITSGGILNGVPYYHLYRFYEFLGIEKKLYIMFADITDETSDVSALETMLVESDCEVFQIGIWTDTNIFSEDNGQIIFSPFISHINNLANMIKGTEDADSGYPSELNVIICGGLGTGKTSKTEINYKDLPDCTEMDYNMLSILIGEDQAVYSDKTDRQIGLLGMAMACLSEAGAEESLAYVKSFNLNKDDIFADMVLGVGADGTLISSINTVQRHVLANKGYIYPITYDEIEGGIYFCSDSTMSYGDFGTISSNRVTERLKRIIKRVLIPYINSPVYFDNNISTLSSSSATEINNAIQNAINLYMVNSENNSQLSASLITVSTSQPDLKNDKLAISFLYSFLESENVINFLELYNTK